MRDGIVDSTFRSPDVVSAYLNDLLPLSDGKILVGGQFGLSGYSAEMVLARLNRDGSTD